MTDPEVSEEEYRNNAFGVYFSRSEDKKERNVKLLLLLYLSYLELQLREEEPGVAGDDD